MTILVTLVVAVAAFAFIIFPFFRQRLGMAGYDEPDGIASGLEPVDPTLRQLELDRESGILTEEDYRDQEARFRGEPGPTTRKPVTSEKQDALDAEIEEEVRKRRRGRTQEGVGLCPQCGERAREGDRFCASCGSNLFPGGGGA